MKVYRLSEIIDLLILILGNGWK